MKILDRGYWISLHFYWQSLYHYFKGCIKFRSFTYFSICNPSIDLGGMLDDRKTDIYALLPKNIVPITTIITSLSATKAFIKNNNLAFPFIIKPNVGLKGYKVTKIRDAKELDHFLDNHDVSEREWLFQEYLDHHKEYAVLFYKYPTSKKYGIHSFIEKVYPYVIGDGKSQLEDLINDYKNPFLEKDSVFKKFENRLSEVPKEGEKITLDVIGNYSRGAKFYNRIDCVNHKMENMLSDIFQNVEGLNFFRIDFKANSIEDFLQGNFKILEINGMKSEPLHIYDPQSSFKTNKETIKKHWEIVAGIVCEQRKVMKDFPSLKHGLKALLSIKKLTR